MKQICLKIDERLLEELDKVVDSKPCWIKRNTAINHAVRNYINQSRNLFDDKID